MKCQHQSDVIDRRSICLFDNEHCSLWLAHSAVRSQTKMKAPCSVLVPCTLKSKRANRSGQANACSIAKALAWLAANSCWVTLDTGTAAQVSSIVHKQRALKHLRSVCMQTLRQQSILPMVQVWTRVAAQLQGVWLAVNHYLGNAQGSQAGAKACSVCPIASRPTSKGNCFSRGKCSSAVPAA